MGWTNRGKFSELAIIFRTAAAPANFYVALVTNAILPDPDTNLMSDLTEIAAGNGYTAGGISLNRDAVDFDVIVEDDVADVAYTQVKDVAWTAAGGTLPSAGAGASFVVMTDDAGVVANRNVYAFWSLGDARILANGETMTLADLELRLTE